MAQINLLKQPDSSTTLWQTVPKFFGRLLVVVLIALVGYYGWLYFQAKSINNQITSTQAKIDADKQSALNAPGRDEFLTRQQQLKNLSDLISAHVYFSKLLPKLAQDTLKKATYTSLKITPDGELVLTVDVPTLEDMDKYLQVFNLPDVNANFYNVRVSAYHKTLGQNSTGIEFQVTMNYNGSIIQYDASQTGN